MSASALPAFPPAIYQFVHQVFSAANVRIAEKIARVPNCHEPALDQTLIEYLSNYSSPHCIAPGWFVQIDVHYLGGLRHFYSWEIADIGLLVFAKRTGRVLARKVALLQSKRLYPESGGVIEESPEDFNIGMGRLLPSDEITTPLSLNHSFHFTKDSRYAALKTEDDQYKAVKEYEKQRKIPVHYLLYNPWRLPATYTLPLRGGPKLGRAGNGGARVIPATRLRAALKRHSTGYSPSFSDLSAAISSATAERSGWRLEHFVSELVMKCHEGQVFRDLQEENIFALFNRRSGPIAAAVAVTVEQVGD